MNTRTLPLLFAGLAALALPALAADWPQWRGPDRNDVSKETGLLKSWPKDGPKLLWTFKNAGAGYSCPAVVGDHLYCAGSGDKGEFVFALDVTTGNQLWSTVFAPPPSLTQERGEGPRGSPTVDGGLIFIESDEGDLACIEAASGKLHWQKALSLKNDFGGKVQNTKWGFSESPLVDGDKLICTPGGSKGTLLALNKQTGEVLWQSKESTDNAAFSSPMAADIGGMHQYIQMTPSSILGVAANDGHKLWQFSRNGPTAAIPTPVIKDNFVYVTSGYNAGCNLIKVNSDGKTFTPEQVYANKNMVNHHGGVVLVGEYRYGYSDGGKGWVCQKLADGSIVWNEKDKLGKGSLTCADGHLYCYSEGDGTVVLIEATPDGWKESGRFTLPEKSKIRKSGGTKFWTHPVVANGKLYLRDQDLLFCYDVKE
jgi:outer membrane protein assembly factor BamB